MDRKQKLIELLQEDPNDSFLNHALALELIKEGDDNKAREIFESILAREPSYVGSYYHLGKLLERAGQPALALEWYEKGMQQCRMVKDMHAYNELQAAAEDL